VHIVSLRAIQARERRAITRIVVFVAYLRRELEPKVALGDLEGPGPSIESVQIDHPSCGAFDSTDLALRQSEDLTQFGLSHRGVACSTDRDQDTAEVSQLKRIANI
jgi:hypothetical protein